MASTFQMFLALTLSSALALPPPTTPLLGMWEVSGVQVPVSTTPFATTSLGTWLDMTTPDGTVVKIVPFWTSDYVRSQNESTGEEILTPTGTLHFAARYAPRTLGVHTFLQRFSMQSSITPLNGSFECVATGAIAGDGFARVDARYGQYFTLNGETSQQRDGRDLCI